MAPGSARRPVSLLLVAAIALSGCASSPYYFGQNLEGPNTLLLREGEEQIERGRPNVVIDKLGSWVFGLPSKILLLNRKVDNHDISEETAEAIHEYLAANDLHNVKVRLNQYAPGDEWRRLFANRDVNPLWRFTVGTLTVLLYTLLPQRLLGGDNYNPFTNTISLYSDVRAIALHEGGHAKDFAPMTPFTKGLYATVRILPLVPLAQEAAATSDAIGYEKAIGAWEEQKDAYRILYPAYGTYVGGEISRWVAAPSIGIGYAIQYGPVVPGHIVGWIASGRVEELDAMDDELPDPLLLEFHGDEIVGYDPAEPAGSGHEVHLDSVHQEGGVGVQAGTDDQPVVR